MGTRFDSLIEMDNAPTALPPIKHKSLARLTTAELDKLTNDERKAEVQKLKEDIRALEIEKKEKRNAAAAESKENRVEEEVKQSHDQDKVEEDQDEVGEAELGQGWKTVKPSARR